MTSPTRTPIHWTRAALLATTVAMAAGLVLTGVAAYRGAVEASEEIVDAQAFDLKRALWRELARGEGTLEEDLADAVAVLDEQGLRYAAVLDRDRAIVASAGTSSDGDTEIAEAVAAMPAMQTVEAGERVRVLEPFRERQGRRERSSRRSRGMNRAEFGEPGDPLEPHESLDGGDPRDSWRAQRAERRAARRGVHGSQLVLLEFEPVLARDLRQRAATTLVISSVAGAVLLLFAGAVWRLNRQADLAAAQLARDRHLAALGEMSAVLNHEIRNPLASLKGHAQLMLEKLPDDHAARPKAERVVHEALRLEELTGQVLAFARSGQLQRVAVDPLEVARAAAEQVDGAVDVAAEGELRPWPLDRERFEQVLVNVIRNGAQASPDGAAVEVRVAQDGGRLVVTVRDRGAGVPAGEEQRIFEAFHTQRVRGTGLGLALARRIVEGHGGTIAASNHPDGGALFRIEIPEEA